MKRTIALLLIIGFSFLSNLVNQKYVSAQVSITSPVDVETVASEEQKFGTIQGTIYDPALSRIQGATIRLECNKQRHEFESSMDGTYTAKVTAGIYSVLVTANAFVGIRRAAVKIEPGSTVIFDFTMEVGASHMDAFHYEDVSIPKSPDPLLAPLMRYGCRNETEDMFEYEGLMRYWTEGNTAYEHVDKRKYIGPTLSYNRLTIHADIMHIDKKSLTLEAIGNVTVEDGTGNTILMKTAKLDLKAKNPITTLTGEKTTELNQPIPKTLGKMCGDRIPL